MEVLLVEDREEFNVCKETVVFLADLSRAGGPTDAQFMIQAAQSHSCALVLMILGLILSMYLEGEGWFDATVAPPILPVVHAHWPNLALA